MTKSNTNRFVGAAWSLLVFQFIASAGAVAVTAWAVLEVQPRLAQLQAMQQNEAASAAPAVPAPAAPASPAPSPPPPPAPPDALQLPPAFGSVDMLAGEQRSQDVHAGGGFDASRIGATCGIGFITEQPTFALRYRAGGLPLHISAGSLADTTLIVRGPDGSWLCNDDAEGYNPRVSWESPASGTYLIWVGSLRGANQIDAGVLYMSHQPPGVIQ